VSFAFFEKRLPKLAGSGAHRFLYLLAGNGLSAALGFLLLVMLTRTLAPEAFGNFTKIINFLDIGIVLVDIAVFAGAAQIAAKHIKDDPARAAMALKVAFYMRLAIALLFAVGGYAGSASLSAYLFGDERS
jgi:O-antigen/teichoic acid export membrane protein